MLSSIQHQGVFLGMLTVGVGASGLKIGTLKFWTVAGCLASAAALAVIAALGQVGPGAPLGAAVFALGFANGAFAVAAIASMMDLAGSGRARREGTRVGFWGAAQAIGFGLGAFGGAAAVDAARVFLDPARAYGLVFLLEGALFVAAALLALRIAAPRAAPALVPGE
jgi:MFS transporter, BCD family, chlorophyll transporter